MRRPARLWVVIWLTRAGSRCLSWWCSKNMWERRISIVATHFFIRQGEYAETTGISLLLLNDKEDLIHKAVGWMLREVGKKDRQALEEFLRRHGRVMPRTSLRYAIERFPKELAWPT